MVLALAHTGQGAQIHQGRGVRRKTVSVLVTEVPEVPDSEHDMQLDAVVTEQGVIRPEEVSPA